MTKGKPKLGRPSKYTEEKGLAICAEMASGRSLRSICNDEGMPDKTTVFRWLASFPDFHTQYARAQEDRAASFAEEILEIADDTDVVNVQKAKLQIDTRRWLMSKMAPKKFSDKQSVELSGAVEVKRSVSDMTDEELAAIATASSK